jgi:hypothetical protein
MNRKYITLYEYLSLGHRKQDTSAKTPHDHSTACNLHFMKQISIYIIVLFVETPRKFITAKLSIRKPGSSSVLIIILLALMKIRAYGSNITSTDEDPGLRIESFAVINLRGVSTNKTIIYFISMQTYKELKFQSVIQFH